MGSGIQEKIQDAFGDKFGMLGGKFPTKYVGGLFQPGFERDCGGSIFLGEPWNASDFCRD